MKPAPVQQRDVVSVTWPAPGSLTCDQQLTKRQYTSKQGSWPWFEPPILLRDLSRNLVGSNGMTYALGK